MVILGYHFDVVSVVAGFVVGAIFVSVLGHFRPPRD
jgi:multisubunit Na+/H+ antiporter MnhE subunit